MNARRSAFTLIEVLLALMLSSFIILGLMRLHQGVVRYLDAAREMIGTDRMAAMVIHQLERDLSTAYIPFLAKEEKEDKEKGPKKSEAEEKQPEKPEEPKAQKEDEKTKEKAKERRKSFFVGLIDERAESTKIDGKKKEPCKYISFISTNPLQMFEDRKQRLVRIVYEVVVDKTKGSRDVAVYQLIRRETSELNNVRGQEDETAARAKRKTVSSYMVAENVKGFWVSYITLKPRDSKKKETEQDLETVVNTWGDVAQTQGVVPQRVEIWIDFFNAAKTRVTSYHTLIPIYSYPTTDADALRKQKQKSTPAVDEKDKQQKDAKDAGKPGQDASGKPAAAQPGSDIHQALFEQITQGLGTPAAGGIVR